MKLSQSFYDARKLVDVVENQTSYGLQDATLHIFETHAQAEKVELRFGSPVLASMFEGKKRMHVTGKESFDFLPGESLILPANALMCIDFPEARMDNPTRCLALEISEDRIKKVINLMNEEMEKADGREWELMDYNFHFINDTGIYQILQRLVYLFTENHPSRDFFVSNMLRELVIRILQTNSRNNYSSQALGGSHRFAFLVDYIRQHLRENLSVELLSEKACMSSSNFHKVFRHEFGLSPVDFINQERIEQAATLLKDPQRDVTDVYLACGFRSRSYFNRMFKRLKGVSPGSYRKRFV